MRLPAAFRARGRSAFYGAAALGAVAGKAEKELEALENIDEASVSAAKALLDAGAVTAEMTGIDSEIYIRADVKTEMDVCSVTIRHTHTNIVSIVLNGEELLEPVHETRAGRSRLRRKFTDFRLRRWFPTQKQFRSRKFLFSARRFP